MMKKKKDVSVVSTSSRSYVIDYMEEYISDFLLNEFHDGGILWEKLHMLDEKIAKFQKENYSGDSYSAYYGMVNNITARIHLMKELNYSKQEIREYRQKYRNFSEIRKYGNTGIFI